jgi:hypothetical protein
MQLFGLHYYVIVDKHDSSWYSMMLDYFKLLNMNNFLHDAYPYLINWLRLYSHAPSSRGPQSGPFSTAHPVWAFVENDIFDSNPANMGERAPNAPIDLPNWGTTSRSEGHQTNQFGMNEGAFSGSNFVLDHNSFLAYGLEPSSLSWGYMSQRRSQPSTSGPVGFRARRSSHLPNAENTKLQRFWKGHETLGRAWLGLFIR